MRLKKLFAMILSLTLLSGIIPAMNLSAAADDKFNVELEVYHYTPSNSAYMPGTVGAKIDLASEALSQDDHIVIGLKYNNISKVSGAGVNILGWGFTYDADYLQSEAYNNNPTSNTEGSASSLSFSTQFLQMSYVNQSYDCTLTDTAQQTYRQVKVSLGITSETTVDQLITNTDGYLCFLPFKVVASGGSASLSYLKDSSFCLVTAFDNTDNGTASSKTTKDYDYLVSNSLIDESTLSPLTVYVGSVATATPTATAAAPTTPTATPTATAAAPTTPTATPTATATAPTTPTATPTATATAPTTPTATPTATAPTTPTATPTATDPATPSVYSVTFNADGSVKATAPEAGTYSVIFAAYTDGVLTGVATADAVFDAAGEIPVAVPESFNADGADTVKAMLWSAVGDMLPLCGAASR